MALTSWIPFGKASTKANLCDKCKEKEKGQKCNSCKEKEKAKIGENMRLSKSESFTKELDNSLLDSPSKIIAKDLELQKSEIDKNEKSSTSWDLINEFIRKESLEFPNSMTPQQALELEEAPTMLWPMMTEDSLDSYLPDSFDYYVPQNMSNEEGSDNIGMSNEDSSLTSDPEPFSNSEGEMIAPPIMVARLKGDDNQTIQKGVMVVRTESAINFPNQVNKGRRGSFSELVNPLQEENYPSNRRNSIKDSQDPQAPNSAENDKMNISLTDTVRSIVDGLDPESHDYKQKKTKLIEEAISNCDVALLKQLAISKGGLLSSALRSEAWPIMLNADKNHAKRSKVDKHPDDDQILKDAQKAFKRIPSGLEDKKRKRKRLELIELLKAIFQREPELSYYQGFHEIAAIFLLVIGKRKVANSLQNLALNYLRDSMQGTLGPMMRQMALSSFLLKSVDPRLYQFLLDVKAQSYYGLSWVLTWFTYSSDSLSKSSRYIDLFIASNPMLPVYIMAAATIERKDSILKLQKERTVVYEYLKTFPSEFDCELLIEKGLALYRKYPPNVLQKESKVSLSEYSCINRYEEDWDKVKDKASYIEVYEKIQGYIAAEAEAKKARVQVGCGPDGCELPSDRKEAQAKSQVNKGNKALGILKWMVLFGIMIVILGITYQKGLPYVSQHIPSLTERFPILNKIAHTTDSQCQEDSCELNAKKIESGENQEPINENNNKVNVKEDQPLSSDGIVDKVKEAILFGTEFTSERLIPFNQWVVDNVWKRAGLYQE